jgi:CO/xanthine dehydrogenase FAD-binding subunit
VADSEEVRAAAPLLGEAASLVGHPAVRNRGTIGGAIAEADPAGHLPPAILALEGSVKAESVRGSRWVAAADLFLGFLTTNIEPDEVITAVAFPPLPPGAGSAFQQVVRRRGDFPVALAVAVVSVGRDGRIAEARISVGGAGPTAVRVPEAERILAGAPPGEEPFGEAARAAGRGVDPVDNAHASAAYRRRAVAALTHRAVGLAVRRADDRSESG